MSKYCLHLLNNAFLHWLTLVYWFQFQLALGETEMILVTKRTSSEESDDWKMEWSHGKYFCSCLVYLYKSMSIWNLMYNCPGWVFCPQKPHPFGNEYHSMCFVECAVMLNVEVVKGKDCPWKLGPSKFKDCCGKTVGLFCLCWRSIFSTGRYIIFDSSFCVLKGIVELKKMGFCGGIDKEAMLLAITCPWRSNQLTFPKQGWWRYGCSQQEIKQSGVFHLDKEEIWLHNWDYGCWWCIGNGWLKRNM